MQREKAIGNTLYGAKPVRWGSVGVEGGGRSGLVDQERGTSGVFTCRRYPFIHCLQSEYNW